jgi:hypothetical protein
MFVSCCSVSKIKKIKRQTKKLLLPDVAFNCRNQSKTFFVNDHGQKHYWLIFAVKNDFDRL